MEKLLFRPDISNHLAHLLATNLTPVIERHVKDAIAKTFIPVYSQQASSMHQELLRELRGEIHGVKSELTAWQNEAFRSHDVSTFWHLFSIILIDQLGRHSRTRALSEDFIRPSQVLESQYDRLHPSSCTVLSDS